MKGNTLVTKMGVTILIIICLSGNYRVINGLTPAQCHEERRILVSACKPVVYRVPPSAYCCQRIRVTDIQCVCTAITPKIAPLVTANLDYALGVVRRCGRQIPRHFKCGSITTP
ncbi:hypothetical protein RND81_03G123900 [Saponaria officinalis]|uniref:Bifunctional inhibitor/plant lipid transfer protein/seed storage helical domain-containing protein n=1 Tax=Saponaria officinalis TaxID=3572 RepID=A0AAW1M6K3_SAPOF